MVAMGLINKKFYCTEHWPEIQKYLCVCLTQHAFEFLLGDMMSTILTAVQRLYTIFSDSSQRWSSLMKQSNDLNVILGYVWWECSLDHLKHLDCIRYKMHYKN